MLETMLDYVRISLYALLVVIAFFLFQAWEKEHPKVDQTVISEIEKLPAGHLPSLSTNATSATVPTGVTTAAPSKAAPAVPPLKTAQLVKVKTDLLDVSIDTLGGDVVSVSLLHYPQSLKSTAPIQLFNDNAKTRYIAESGLLSNNGPDTSRVGTLYLATHGLCDEPRSKLIDGDVALAKRWNQRHQHI